jgi:hypothetical protein
MLRARAPVWGIVTSDQSDKSDKNILEKVYLEFFLEKPGGQGSPLAPPPGGETKEFSGFFYQIYKIYPCGASPHESARGGRKT